MKKLVILLVLALIFSVGGCSRPTNSSESNTRSIKLITYKCIDDNANSIKDCAKNHDNLEKQGSERTVEIPSDFVNNPNFSNLSSEVQKSIFRNDGTIGRYIDNSEIDGRNIIIKKTANNNCKTYDVSLDLTYFDWKSASEGEINKYLSENRIDRLEKFFEGNNTQGLKLQAGDKVVLRFIGLLNKNGVGTALNDQIILNYKSPCETEETRYTIGDDLFEINNMKGELTYYYTLNEGDSTTSSVKNIYSDMDSLMGKIKEEFYDRYGKNSEGTYLLDHFVNIMPYNYKEDYVYVILSDFLFQLSPSDKKIIKGKYCSNGNSYCNDSLYQFNADNISSKYVDGYFFKSLFTKYIFESIPSINNLCPTGNNSEKFTVYLLGINSVSGLSNQDKMKDFYSNYLLKNCNIYYK